MPDDRPIYGSPDPPYQPLEESTVGREHMGEAHDDPDGGTWDTDTSPLVEIVGLLVLAAMLFLILLAVN